MLEFITSISKNHILQVAFWAWFIAQVLKVPIYALVENRVDWRRVFGAGGMPSSHSALVVALAMCVGRGVGWDSVDFAISAVMAGVVMYDATGVRREAGKQAEAINQIISDIYHGTQISQERLKELIGHSPFEVVVGAIIGLLLSFLLY